MKNKKSSKQKHDSESSSSSSSSDSSSSDGSSSSSESASSPPRKKSSKSKKLPQKEHSEREPAVSSEDERRKAKRRRSPDVDKVKTVRRDLETSRWDSPVDKSDKKKKTDRRESESRDKEYTKKDNYGDKRDRKQKRDDHRSDRPDHSRYNSDDRHHRRHDDRERYKERDDRRQRHDDHDRHYRDDDRRNRSRSSPNDSRNNKRRRSRSPSFDHSKATWGKSNHQQQQQQSQNQNNKKDSKPNQGKEKEKPNFGLSGKLTEETNTYRGVVIKYSEPPEARKPKRRWRLYPFKGEKAMQTLYIHRESAYLIGRDRKVVDLPVDHPSCSKQHAALQYRLVPFTREDGSNGKRVRPYLIDLDSANGTYINNKKIDPRKYVELLEKDVIKFGYSSREYVLLHENSKDEAQDDDVKLEDDIVKKEPED